MTTKHNPRVNYQMLRFAVFGIAALTVAHALLMVITTPVRDWAAE